MPNAGLNSSHFFSLFPPHLVPTCAEPPLVHKRQICSAEDCGFRICKVRLPLVVLYCLCLVGLVDYVDVSLVVKKVLAGKKEENINNVTKKRLNTS